MRCNRREERRAGLGSPLPAGGGGGGGFPRAAPLEAARPYSLGIEAPLARTAPSALRPQAPSLLGGGVGAGGWGLSGASALSSGRDLLGAAQRMPTPSLSRGLGAAGGGLVDSQGTMAERFKLRMEKMAFEDSASQPLALPPPPTAAPAPATAPIRTPAAAAVAEERAVTAPRVSMAETMASRSSSPAATDAPSSGGEGEEGGGKASESERQRKLQEMMESARAAPTAPPTAAPPPPPTPQPEPEPVAAIAPVAPVAPVAPAAESASDGAVDAKAKEAEMREKIKQQMAALKQSAAAAPAPEPEPAA